MNWLKFLWQHFIASWKYWFSVAGLAFFLYRIYGPLKGEIQAWLQRQIVAPEGETSVGFTLEEGSAGAITVMLILFSIVLVTLITTVVALYTSKSTGTISKAKGDILLKTFHRTTQAADLISKKLFPGASLPIKRVIRYKQVYTVYENGDCNLTEVQQICAKDKNIHFIERGLTAEPESASVEFPDEIDLKITSRTSGKQITYLINKNEPHIKSVIIFFLPFIRAGVDDKREVKTTLFWKGFMRKLTDTGEEEFNSQVKSVDPVEEIEYQFWVKPRMGKLECFHIGENLESGAETLEPAEDEKGMKGWIYRARNVPGNHWTRLRLELKKS